MSGLSLEGSCHCGAVRFAVASHTPVPYQLCYCSICRKTSGGGGYAINLGARMDSLSIEGAEHLGVFRAEIHDEDGACRLSSAERNFCTRCGCHLWLYDPTWPELVHPLASVIDTPLPEAPARTHIMLDFKPDWIPLQAAPQDRTFARYPDASLEDWHRAHGLWAE
ncbi:GFA family protein [Pararhodobacter marinus]|uniref:GFA family protein n=1 Tax=Pararhodobacter marinus TaxID=2184063 RepID=UPI003512A111